MFYSCGNGLGIYLTTEEYFSISDEEFDYIIKTKCYGYVDPFYSSKQKLNFDGSIFEDDDIKIPPQQMSEILNILDMKDNIDIFTGFENIDDLEIEDSE